MMMMMMMMPMTMMTMMMMDGDGHGCDDGDCDGDGGDDDADDNEKEVEVVHSSTAADTCDTSYVFSSHILVSVGSVQGYLRHTGDYKELLRFN